MFPTAVFEIRENNHCGGVIFQAGNPESMLKNPLILNTATACAIDIFSVIESGVAIVNSFKCREDLTRPYQGV